MSNQTKIQSLTLSFFAFVLLCLASNIAYAQNQRMGNSGGDGMQLLARSIPGVDVIVKRQPGSSPNARSGDLVATGKTDSAGQFNLGVLPAGEYTITVKIPDETADSIESIVESANANAKTYSDSKSNTAALAQVAISGAASVTLITSVDLSRRHFSSQAVPVFGKIYEIKIQATGRQVVTGQVSIVIDEPSVK